MKICPKCGRVADEDAVRCFCGTDLGSIRKEETKTSASGSGINMKITVGHYTLTLWDIAFILLCNLSFVLIVVDLLTGKGAWCPYIILTLYTVYFLAFACTAGSVKRFHTRYRNAVLLLNLLGGIFGLISHDMRWINNYFIPCNSMLAAVAFLLMLFHKDISAKHVFWSTLLLLVENGIQFILFLCGVVGQTQVSKIFIVLALCLNLMIFVNLAFLYVTKFRTHVERNRWWK